MQGVKVARGSSANYANIGTRLFAMREHINGKHSDACFACAVRCGFAQPHWQARPASAGTLLRSTTTHPMDG